jgi:beta-lactamase regulating signal transducer with metallopeptidase domain
MEWLVGFAAKGVLLLAMAGVAILALRRASAAARHMTWTLATAGLVALPVLALLPGWRLPVLPRSAPAVGTVAARVPNHAAIAEPARYAHNDEAPSPTGSEPRATQGASPWLLIAWAAGACAVVARLLAGLAAARARGRRAVRVTAGPLARLLDEAAGVYRLRRRVSLRLDLRGTVPSTWGVLRPTVLLPADAEGWPADRLRAVLLHELAHVARGDFPAQVVARLACALHWFNPLAWLADRQIRVESERASDEFVLAAGLKRSDYAAHLLDVLGAVRRAQAAPAAAVAMARCTGFEGRLRAILDGPGERRGLSTTAVTLAALGAAGILLPLGAARLEARPHEPKAADQRRETASKGVVKLPGGASIEVVGVSSCPSGPGTWWRPDGSPLAEAPCDPPSSQPQFGNEFQLPNAVAREVVVRVTGLPEGSDLIWYPRPSVSNSPSRPNKDGKPAPGLLREVAQISGNLKTFEVGFRLAVGAWKTEYAHDGGGGFSTSRGSHSFYFGKARPVQRGTAIAVAHNITDLETRVVAVDRDGREHTSSYSSGGGPGGKVGLLDAEFDLPPERVREYRIQSRPVEQGVIDGIALHPRRPGR